MAENPAMKMNFHDGFPLQTLPDKTSTDEQKELLELLLKTHELEIENVSLKI